MINLKNLVKSVYYQVKFASGEDGRILRNINQKQYVPILNLHRVSPDSNHFWDPMQPKHFDELLKYLKKHFYCTTFAGLSEKSSKPALILSFDDGYEDFLQYACPILDKHQLKANMNIIPFFTETGTLPWNIVLYDFLERAPDSLINKVEIPCLEKVSSMKSPVEKTRFGIKISGHFKNRPMLERNVLWAKISPLISEWGERPNLRMMNIAEVKQVAKTHEIGVHSYRHDSMGHETMDYFSQDLQECQSFFAQKLELPMNIYAFPNGSYQKEQVDHLLQSKLQHVLLVDETYSQRQNNIHARFTISGESLGEIKLKSLGHKIAGRK
jgi:peptidoglycan/xylan/chitin deacetylase (PgdA/CDA1 family)